MAGFQRVFSKFNGYTFVVPSTWVPVRGSGADVFYRNPANIDESLFVNVSSPSSSKFKSVEDLGTPEQSAEKYLKQYLTEFMSTRLGVRRPAELIGASSVVADDGLLYYTCELNVRSFVNSNQLAINPEERIPYLEWDRRYLQVAGVANRRLYELRLQAPEKTYARDEKVLRDIVSSFRVLQLVAPEPQEAGAA